ncbi:hypothetical protein AGR4A_Lc60147 [Agrobacterium tumefaciens str. B6]|uniref:Uncharacterized protein n=1 Tax=Agrobacterium tumefaciens str. B6 TaxID=1183423 RepID=A0A822VB98_AGRTU|nr:hypothetical protein AGR4A_Lc60147 [Agrobacterium tumefaciens str. B6]
MPGTCPVKETEKGGRVVTLIKRKGSYAFENVQVKTCRHGIRRRTGGRFRKSGFCR